MFLVNGAPEHNRDQCCSPNACESDSDVACVSESLDVKTDAEETEKGMNDITAQPIALVFRAYAQMFQDYFYHFVVVCVKDCSMSLFS